MIRVNGQDFPIYQLDTRNSIINRIASSMETAPKYLYFPDGLSTEKDADNTVIDLLNLIKTNAGENTIFEDFIESFPDQKDLDLRKDILEIWLAFNTGLQTTENFSQSALLTSVQALIGADKPFKKDSDFQSFWRGQRSMVKSRLERLIENNRMTSEKDEQLANQFQKIDDDDAWVVTDYKTTKINLEIFFDVREISLLEIFNSIVLKEVIPFVKCGKYYKILKDYVPPEEWADIQEENLVMKINDKLLVDTQKIKDYTDVTIGILEEKLSATVELVTERNYLSQEQFINRMMSVFVGTEMKVKNTVETHVFGNFYFPQKRFNTYVFSDLVMNDDVFSRLINIDESVKLTKRKKDAGQPWLHIHFDHQVTGPVSASISQRIVDRSDPLMRVESDEIFPHGDPYIRVHAKAKDIESINFFRNILSKLFFIYSEKEEEIIKEYEVFIPDFNVHEELEVRAQRKQTFAKKYTRFCPEERMPTIIDQKEVEDYESKNFQVMKFPRDRPENPPFYPSDDRNQQYYVCLNKDFSFPGIQDNNLENADEYPYVPCCFKMNQNKEGGVYRNYFYQEDLKIKDKKQQELIVTDKFLEAEQFGKLPDNLQKLFSLLDTESDYTYIRVGVESTYSSFLHAVMVCLHEKTGILKLSAKNQKKEVDKARQKLAEQNIAPMARQCAYDIPIENLIQKIENLEAYFDPKIFCQLLEGYFNCNIFLFNRDQLIIPRHVQGYYKEKRIANCLFIYEHWGSESDHARFPRCELICRWNKKQSKNTQYFFPYEQIISQNMGKIFRLINDSYVLDRKLKEIEFPLNENIEMISQKIDNYGKTRCIFIKYHGKTIPVITSPISPLALPETKEQIEPSDVRTTLDLMQEMGIEVLSQTVSNQFVKEINGNVGNVSITIPVIEETMIENIPTSNIGMHFSEKETSVLQIYNRNRKFARYLVEYVFWLFSRYLEAKKILVITDDVLAKFARDQIQVIPEHDYKQINKLFSTTSSVMKNNKLVVTSDDMLKRLIYVLKLYSIRDIKSLRNYRNHRAIIHYYVNITDFDSYPNQTILQGENAIDKWIQESRFVNVLHNDIVVGSFMPFFFSNNLVVKNTIFLAQNANSLSEALNISITWQRDGYNPKNMIPATKIENPVFTLYSYISPENIQTIPVSGNVEPNHPIRILGYKLNGTPFYTALLNL